MNLEQQELDNLQQLADATDSANGAPLVDQNGVELPPPLPPVDYMNEAGAAVDTFAALAVGYAPKAADLWDDEAKQRIKAALAPVMQKYSFSLGAIPPELTLIIVAGPVLYQTSKVVAAQMAEQRIKAKPAPVQAAGQPASQAPDAAQLAPGQANELSPLMPTDRAPAAAVHPQTALYPTGYVPRFGT